MQLSSGARTTTRLAASVMGIVLLPVLVLLHFCPPRRPHYEDVPPPVGSGEQQDAKFGRGRKFVVAAAANLKEENELE